MPPVLSFSIVSGISSLAELDSAKYFPVNSLIRSSEKAIEGIVDTNNPRGAKLSNCTLELFVRSLTDLSVSSSPFSKV